VTPPVFLAPVAQLAGRGVGDRLRLQGSQGRHAATVRRLERGEQLDLVDGAGVRARCAVLAVVDRALDLEVLSVCAEPPPDPRLVLVQALAKGDRGEQAVEAATEVGVDEVVPWAAARSVAQWRGERGERSRERWRVTADEAAKQSRRAWLPAVTGLVSTQELAGRVRASALAVLLHGPAERPLAGLALPGGGDVLLIVGPEGGVTEEEREVLRTAGAVEARLGAGVLRTSTAGVAALAVLSAAHRWR